MSDLLRRFAGLPAALLLVVLAAAWTVPGVGDAGLAGGDTGDADRLNAALDELDPSPIVLVGFDPDVGTYAEIRPTVRMLLAALLARDARIAVVSVTVEGRALAATELARLRRLEADASRLLDLGFIPGAEAALVDLTRGIRAIDAEGGRAVARALETDGWDAVSALLVVGGNDIGPRSWIEQVAPRIEPLPIIGVTPTVLLPEVQPYLASGQLTALIGTPRDGAAYREAAEIGTLDRLVDPAVPRTVPLIVGLLVAAAVMGQALIGTLLRAGRSLRERDAA